MKELDLPRRTALFRASHKVILAFFCCFVWGSSTMPLLHVLNGSVVWILSLVPCTAAFCLLLAAFPIRSWATRATVALLVTLGLFVAALWLAAVLLIVLLKCTGGEILFPV